MSGRRNCTVMLKRTFGVRATGLDGEGELDGSRWENAHLIEERDISRKSHCVLGQTVAMRRT